MFNCAQHNVAWYNKNTVPVSPVKRHRGINLKTVNRTLAIPTFKYTINKLLTIYYYVDNNHSLIQENASECAVRFPILFWYIHVDSVRASSMFGNILCEVNVNTILCRHKVIENRMNELIYFILGWSIKVLYIYLIMYVMTIYNMYFTIFFF